MALVNELGQGRFNKGLTSYFVLKGANTAVPQVAPEIQPVFGLADPPMDFRWLAGEYSWGRAFFIAAVAARFSRSKLRNPAGSGALVLVDQIIFSTATACAFAISSIAIDATNLAVTLTGLPLDGRQNTGAGSTAVPSAADAATSLGGGTAFVNCQAFDTRVLEGGWVINPGSALQVDCEDANVASLISWRWRERPVDQNELLGG